MRVSIPKLGGNADGSGFAAPAVARNGEWFALTTKPEGGFTTLGVRDICPECWAEGTMSEVPIGRHGTLYTYTVIHQLPHGYEEPFAVGYVDLADGVRVFAHIENASKSLVIGADLELASMRLRRDDEGVWLSGPVYRAQ